MELAKATVKLRDESDIPIVGFDIAGSEWGHPADEHKQSYDYVHKHFLHKTVHAGEASGPESIFSALTSLIDNIKNKPLSFCTACESIEKPL